MGTQLSALIVEDSASDAALVVHQLQQDGFDVFHQRVESAAAMRSALAARAWDVVLSDFNVPGFGAFPALALLRESRLDIPFILVSGVVGEEVVVALMKAGAHDCVMKDHLARLAPAVKREVGEAEERLARRRAEAALLESEEIFSRFMEHSPIHVYFKDENIRALRLSKNFETLLGKPLAQLLGKSMDELFPSEFAKRMVADDMKVLREGKAITVSEEFNGRLYSTTKFPILIGGKPRYLAGYTIDVTEQASQLHALQESEKRFRGLIEQSLTGVYIVQDDVFVYANPRLEQMLGYASGELDGVRVDELVVGEDQAILQTERERLQAGAAFSSYEVHVRRKDGSVIEIGVQGSRNEYNGAPATIGMAQDITEKKRAEEEIKRYIAQLRTAFMSTVEVATSLSEMRDPYTAGHERRVAEIAVALGTELGLDEHRLEGLRVAGHLHDVGKITIPAEILSKPGKLNQIEYKLVQEHSRAGYEVLKKVEFPWPVAEVALQHHERMDGSGYPQGLKSEAILLEARIIAVADVIEAMSSHRPYRPGLGIEAAMAEIERGRGTHYDAAIADVALKLFRANPDTLPQ